MYPLSSTGDVQSLVLMKQIRLNISRISWDPETWTSLSILLNPQPKELCLQRGGLVQSLRAPPPLPKPPTVLWGLLLPPVVSAFILLLTILLSLCASNFLASQVDFQSPWVLGSPRASPALHTTPPQLPEPRTLGTCLSQRRTPSLKNRTKKGFTFLPVQSSLLYINV